MKHLAEGRRESQAAATPVLTIGFDDTLPAPRTLLFGGQHLLALTGIWLFPGIIGTALGLSHAEVGLITQGCFLMTGVVTILQSSRLLRLPIVQGPTAAFMVALIASGATHGLGTAFGSLMVAGAVFAALSLPLKHWGLFGHVARVASHPIVFGTLFVIIGAQLATVGLSGWFGQPDQHGFGLPLFLVAAFTVVAVIACTLFGGTSVIRRAAVFWGILAGTVVAASTGLWDGPSVGDVAIVALPTWLPFGFGVDGGVVLLMMLAFLQAGTESAGMYQMVGGWGGQRPDVARTNRGLFTEFLGSVLGAAFGGIGTTSYPENAGIVRVTGVGSRFVTLTAGVLSLVLAFVPAVGLFVASLPGAVLAGASTVLFGIIAVSGIQLLGEVEWDELNMMVAAPSFIIALGTLFLPVEVTAALPASAASMLTNPMMVGVVLLLLLHVVVNLLIRPRLTRPSTPTFHLN
ncbi:uracil-xanthine permease family protein [Nocardioides daejeonensis]|uniref:uracil-xanthine permease family protein n=1 Tax=Nocardioides daejeonensis TaxID=1046556 RepID=UPI000D750420|nr:solute carrier family 23 protein [Nocardioides daejeonensis]